MDEGSRASVWLTLTQKVSVRVLSMSRSGPVVLVSTRELFDVGFQVRFQDGEEKRLAVIESVTACANGDFRVSLRWADQPS